MSGKNGKRVRLLIDQVYFTPGEASPFEKKGRG
jgi:hypothetical protein